MSAAATAAPVRPWMTTPEAAGVLGVSPCTVWRWAHSGVIPPASVLLVRSHVRISRAWVEQGG